MAARTSISMAWLRSFERLANTGMRILPLQGHDFVMMAFTGFCAIVINHRSQLADMIDSAGKVLLWPLIKARKALKRKGIAKNRAPAWWTQCRESAACCRCSLHRIRSMKSRSKGIQWNLVTLTLVNLEIWIIRTPSFGPGRRMHCLMESLINLGVFGRISIIVFTCLMNALFPPKNMHKVGGCFIMRGKILCNVFPVATSKESCSFAKKAYHWLQ